MYCVVLDGWAITKKNALRLSCGSALIIVKENALSEVNNVYQFPVGFEVEEFCARLFLAEEA